MTGIYLGGPAKDYSAMQGPCPDGFHVPIHDEIVALYDAGISLGAWNSTGGNNLKNYLKLPFAGNRGTGGGTSLQGTQGMYQTSSAVGSPYSYILSFNSFAIYQNANGLRGNSYSIRAFKNIYVKPDSTRTVLYQGTGNAGIYHNSTLGLISISSDGTNWITIADKNLGATAVYNNGDALSEANCGKYYQRGNNYGFPRTGSVTTSSTQVNAQNYGPGNYYSSSTFITQNAWDSSDNKNLRGGETGIVERGEVKSIYVGTTPVKEVYVGTTKVRPMDILIDFVLVGGGGGGGAAFNGGGGGGAGGVIYCTNYKIEKGSYNIVIGKCGVGQTPGTAGYGNGGNSCFNELIAYGGGGGGGGFSNNRDGVSGGSGGGGGYYYPSGGVGGTGTSGQGNNGANGLGPDGGGGGGGGSTRAGCQGIKYSGDWNYSGGYMGLGGSYFGQNMAYGGGGGGGNCNQSYVSGGGRGGSRNQNGTKPSFCGSGGGGGGGGGDWGCRGGDGTCGVFIIQYPTDCGYNISGGTKYTSGIYTRHCFTSNGTLTVN